MKSDIIICTFLALPVPKVLFSRQFFNFNLLFSDCNGRCYFNNFLQAIPLTVNTQYSTFNSRLFFRVHVLHAVKIRAVCLVPGSSLIFQQPKWVFTSNPKRSKVDNVNQRNISVSYTSRISTRLNKYAHVYTYLQ